jgi:hypothetical protein
MPRNTKAPDRYTTFDRLPDEGDEPWQCFVLYRDMGPRIPGKPGGRSIENVRMSLGKPESYLAILRHWSVKWDWVARARKYDDELERQNRKAVEKKIPHWAKLRERSHRLNMKLAQDIRKKIRQMLEHPITIEEVKDCNGREVVFLVPAKWTYNTVGNLSQTIADAVMMNAEDDAFDPSQASIEELREFIAKHTGKKAVQGNGEL